MLGFSALGQLALGEASQIAVSRDLSIILEQGVSSTSRDLPVNLEEVVNLLWRDTISPVEELGQVSASGATPAELLGSLSGNFPLQVEVSSSHRADSPLILENLSDNVADVSVQAELSLSVTKDVPALLEVTTWAQVDEFIVVELTVDAALDATLFLENTADHLIDATTTGELTASLQGDDALVLETSADVGVVSSLQAEIVSGVKAVMVDGLAQLEFLADTLSSVCQTIEFMAGVVVDASIPDELLLVIVAEGTQSLELTSNFSLDGPAITIETLLDFAQNTRVSPEYVSDLQMVAEFAAEHNLDINQATRVEIEMALSAIGAMGRVQFEFDGLRIIIIGPPGVFYDNLLSIGIIDDEIR